MKIYTIGHTRYSIEEFLLIIRKYNINCVIDVRSTPYSKYAPQFNEKEFRRVLNMCGIYYINMGKEFGARREDRSLYTEEGYLDFEKVRETAEFKKGVERIKKGCKKNFRITLMCAEKNPFDCHRAILVSRGIKEKGIKVEHIYANGYKVKSQEEIEEEMLDKYFPRWKEIELRIDKVLTVEELIEEAYKKRNKEIGYSIEGGEDYEYIYNRIY